MLIPFLRPKLTPMGCQTWVSRNQAVHEKSSPIIQMTFKCHFWFFRIFDLFGSIFDPISGTLYFETLNRDYRTKALSRDFLASKTWRKLSQKWPNFSTFLAFLEPILRPSNLLNVKIPHLRVFVKMTDFVILEDPFRKMKKNDLFLIIFRAFSGLAYTQIFRDSPFGPQMSFSI